MNPETSAATAATVARLDARTGPQAGAGTFHGWQCQSTVAVGIAAARGTPERRCEPQCLSAT
jgi:hypothetical protein